MMMYGYGSLAVMRLEQAEVMVMIIVTTSTLVLALAQLDGTIAKTKKFGCLVEWMGVVQ